MIKYDIYPKYADKDFAFLFKAQERINDYFVFDINEDFLKYPILNLDYEDIFENELNNVLNDDCYYNASGLILFSKKVVDILKNLDGNITFYSCKLRNQPIDIFALYKRNDVESDYVIRNSEKPTSYYFSELFIDLIVKNNWNIDYYQV
ncbi:hypothetical protein G9F31_15170 [Acinetobacter sp. 187]|uniref:hypothetical protein n=1 Tax=Acinetobacter lanii TaxID=2715163 RepID=UPI00140805BE|nr:hypothetical protein [Acinetobacter lanii]NHC05072.1 hypothetical protein [Acinetobacter lanii]